MGKVIGIDLGTTFSVVSVHEGGSTPTVIANAEGSRLTPSVVGFTEKGERLVGWAARRQAITNPENTVYSIKRFMGRRRNEVSAEEKMVPYRVVGGASDPVKVEIRGTKYTPPEISAMILQSLKETAEAYLGETVTEAVITVPAYFNDSQRQATKDAGKIAGLDVKRIINEPTAAALAYGLDKKANEKIAVYDLGGGTFDISVLEIGDNVVEVRSTNGNTHLGGDDFDQRLINHLADQFQKEHKIDLRKDPVALQRLKEAAEKAKIELSNQFQTEVNLPFICEGPKHLQVTITRARFEQLIDDLITSSMEPVKQALADAKMKPSDIDEVVLVGGSTRIPMVQKMVKDYFGKEPNRSVNPDEVVAVGAAVQGAILGEGFKKDILLLDVTPLTFGVRVMGRLREPLIERNTTIPTTKKKTFTTAQDSQPEVEIDVLQGEREMADDNRSIGKFRLQGIPPAPRGVPQIEVQFDIDANGILNVSAKDLGTGKAESIKIKAPTDIPEADLKRMVKEAEEHADDDKKRREEVEVFNNGDQVVYQTEKMLKEHGEKVSKEAKEAVEKEIEGLKKALKGKEISEVKAAMEAVEKAVETATKDLHKAAEEMYKQAAEKQGPGGKGEEPDEKPQPKGKKGGKDDDNIIDAEFEAK